MSASAIALYPYSFPTIPLAVALPAPATCMKKSFVAIIPIYGRLEGGVSNAPDWKPVAMPVAVTALMKFPASARQFEFAMLVTVVCDVLDKLH